MPRTEQPDDVQRADAIVVGGGHNGLIAAAYLARAGLQTILVEARSEVGGCASTVTDLGARFNICNCDHSMIRAMPLLDELDLKDHGLTYLESEISAVHSSYELIRRGWRAIESTSMMHSRLRDS